MILEYLVFALGPVGQLTPSETNQCTSQANQVFTAQESSSTLFRWDNMDLLEPWLDAVGLMLDLLVLVGRPALTGATYTTRVKVMDRGIGSELLQRTEVATR